VNRPCEKYGGWRVDNETHMYQWKKQVIHNNSGKLEYVSLGLFMWSGWPKITRAWKLWSLLRFVVVRSSHDEGIGRIIFRLVFLTLRWQKEEEDTRKKKLLNSAYRNVGRHSLDICSQVICRVFACAVIHNAKYLTC
jgi:hypothetical protein